MDATVIDLPIRDVNKNKVWRWAQRKLQKTLKSVRQSLVFHLSIIDSIQNGYAGILLSQIARKSKWAGKKTGRNP